MDIVKLKRKIAFIDIEASGLMAGAFPVEVAWQVDNKPGEMLVNPNGAWDETKWDVDAQAIHGIALGDLKRRGRLPRIVAANLAKVLKGRLVFTDSPEQDLGWLDLLHSAGGIERSYQVESLGKLLGHLGLQAETAYGIFAAARETHPPRGRARQGIVHLNEVFEQCIREALK